MPWKVFRKFGQSIIDFDWPYSGIGSTAIQLFSDNLDHSRWLLDLRKRRRNVRRKATMMMRTATTMIMMNHPARGSPPGHPSCVIYTIYGKQC